MRLSIYTTFFILLIILCNRNMVQGARIKKDVAHYPIHITAGSISTWQNNEIRVFQASGNAEVVQGDVRVVADSIIIWFKEIKTGQIIEGGLEIYCSGNVTLFQEENIQDFDETFLELVTTAGVSVGNVSSTEDGQRSGLYAQAEKFKAEERGEQYKEDSPTGTAVTEEMVDIIADDIDSWLENNVRVIVATGNVRIKKGGDTLNADNVILYFDQEKDEEGKSPKQTYKEFYAEGNVTMTRGSDLIIAKKIFQNIKEDKGLFVDSTIESILKPPAVKIEMPAFVRGDEIKNTKGNYEINNGDFSHCGYGHPHYKFKFSKVRIIKSGETSVLTAKNNVFKLGNVPIAYIPYLNFNLQRSPKRLEEWDTGKTTRFGRFVTTKWNLYGFGFGEKLDSWSDVSVNLDYMELKGPRAGTNIKYRKENFSGYLNTYHMNDRDDTGINGVAVENESRGHFLWRNRLMLSKALRNKSDTNDDKPGNRDNLDKWIAETTDNDGWVVDTEISHVKDRTYFREYLQSAFKNEKDRTTLLYLRNISGNRAITFQAEHQLRTYDTLIDSIRLSRKDEKFPELKYRIIGEPLLNGKLNITSETELAYQNRVFDRLSPTNRSFDGTSSSKAQTDFLDRGDLLTAERVFDRSSARFDPEETIRFDTYNMINAPFGFLGQRFNPYIGARLTGYSESIRVDPVSGQNEGGGTARGRVAIPIGISTNTKLSRTYSVYNKFLNINRLRHVIEPELSLNLTPIVTQDPEELNQFDGVDAIDTYQSVKLGLRNRLQTKRGEQGRGETENIVDVGAQLTLFPGNAGLNRRRDDYMGWYLKLNPSDNLSFSLVGNEINLRKGGVDVLNTNVTYTPSPRLSFSLGNRYIDGSSQTVSLSTSIKPNEKWSVSISQQYAFRTGVVDDDSRSLYSGVNVTRLFHDWIATMSIAQIGTRQDDNIVLFNIMPRGLGFATPTLRTLGAMIPQKPQQGKPAKRRLF